MRKINVESKVDNQMPLLRHIFKKGACQEEMFQIISADLNADLENNAKYKFPFQSSKILQKNILRRFRDGFNLYHHCSCHSTVSRLKYKHFKCFRL